MPQSSGSDGARARSPLRLSFPANSANSANPAPARDAQDDDNAQNDGERAYESDISVFRETPSRRRRKGKAGEPKTTGVSKESDSGPGGSRGDGGVGA